MRPRFFGAQQVVQVQSSGIHLQSSTGVSRPIVAGSVVVELHAVPIWIPQIKGFTNTVVRGALERDLELYQAAIGGR
jgi:hypothetical protein